MAYQQFWLPTLKLNLIQLQKLRRLRAGEGGECGYINSLGKRRVRVYTEMTDRQKNFWFLILPSVHKAWEHFLLLFWISWIFNKHPDHWCQHLLSDIRVEKSLTDVRCEILEKKKKNGGRDSVPYPSDSNPSQTRQLPTRTAPLGRPPPGEV